jgi:hypothetical protein
LGYFLVILLSFSTVLAKEYFPAKYFDGVRMKDNMGEVTVLEAPVFRDQSMSSKVIFYFRKGDKINIHPAEFARNRYEEFIDIPNEDVIAYTKTYKKDFPDKMFDEEDEVYYPAPDSRYYKVLLKSGRTGWILKDHIFLITSDRRELSQNVLDEDNTDYRIEEPLPKKFPLKQKTGIRGYGTFGLGISRSSSYPYTERVNQNGYGFTKNLNFSFLRTVDFDSSRRFYFGGMINILSYTNEFELKTRTTAEEHTSMSIGPSLVYDLWKNAKYTFSTQGTLLFNFFNFTNIRQREIGSGEQDQRDFNSYYFTPVMSFLFSIKDVLSEYDLILGTNVIFELSRSYSATNGGNNDSWWSGNSYDRDFAIEANYFVGIQTDY